MGNGSVILQVHRASCVLSGSNHSERNGSAVFGCILLSGLDLGSALNPFVFWPLGKHHQLPN